MDLKQKVKAIQYAFQREGLSIKEDRILALAEIAEVVSFEKQDTILDIGQKPEYLYLILQGMARSFYIDEKGNDITKLFMRENEFLIGEALFMTESLEVFEAIEPMQCLRLPATAFKEILFSDSGLEKIYITMLENTIQYKMKREYAFQCLSAKERYQEFQKTYPHIEERLQQNLIASYLGITKESLSRIRKNM